MRYTFIALRLFTSLAKAYQLTIDDLRAIEMSIMEGPGRSPVIPGSGGVRKMRFASERSGGGKSGGFRICFLAIEEHRHVYLFTLYAKADAQNITGEQKRQMADVVHEIKKLYRKRIGL